MSVESLMFRVTKLASPRKEKRWEVTFEESAELSDRVTARWSKPLPDTQTPDPIPGSELTLCTTIQTEEYDPFIESQFAARN